MANLDKIFDALEQGIAIFDKDRRLLYVNPAMRSVTGRKERTGWSLNDLVQKHQLRTETGEILKTEDFPIIEAFNGKETHEKIFEYISDAEEHAWLSVSCKRILDERGSLQYVFTTISNITERKLQTDKLRFLIESIKILSLTGDFRERIQKKARLAVPSLADWCAIDLVTAEGKIERAIVVHRDRKMIEYVQEFEKRYPSDPNSPTSPQMVIASGEAAFVPRITEEMIREATISEEHAEGIRKLQLKSMMVIPIASKGKNLGCMTLAYAESGRMYSQEDLEFFKEFCDHLGVLFENARLYDEIAQRDRAKDIFLASLSHELRNPLAPIKTSLELLQLRGIPEDMADDVATIEHQFEHMTRLLADLLDVTRYTQSKISLAKSRLDLGALIRRTIRSSEQLIREQELEAAYSIPADPMFVEADATRVEQAITNLISNAIKFGTPGGELKISLEQEDGMAVIRVRDSGIGIEEKDLRNIFEMYFQNNRVRAYNNPGLGLGLFLVKKIAELHGGTIEAKSEGLGQGSEFIMRLPMPEKDAEGRASDYAASEVSRASY